jgi:hypothetical protein
MWSQLAEYWSRLIAWYFERLTRYPHVTALSTLTLVVVLFYWPILLGIRTFPDGDFTHHFLPFHLFQHRELVATRLPIWNPYTYSGHPFLADVQAAVYYPISNLLLLITLPLMQVSERYYVLELEALLHHVLAGYFLFLFVLRYTHISWAALLAGIAFSLSGYLTGYPPLQLAVLRTAVWLPLLLFFMCWAYEAPRQRLRWAGVGMVAATAFCAGHSQTFLYVVYTAAVWGLSLALLSWRRGQLLDYLAGMLIAVMTGLGLAAAQLAPSLEFTQNSVRAQADYLFLSGGFPLQDNWLLLLPGVLSQYSPLYVGLPTLALAGYAVVWALWGQSQVEQNLVFVMRDRRVAIYCLAVVAIVGLMVSYGQNGWLYPIFYRLLPGWDWFRGQERAAYLVALGLCGLAGFGAAALGEAKNLARRRYAVVFGILVTGGVYSFGLLWQLLGNTAITHGEYLLIAAVTLIIGMAVALWLWLPGWSERRSGALLLLLVVNLFWANYGTNLDDLSLARKTLPAPEMEELATVVNQQGAPGQARGRVYNEYRIYENYGMQLEIEDVWGSSPLRLAAYARLFEEFPLDRMWALTGVQHVLTWRRELFVPSMLLAEYPQETDTTYLHRLADEHPRAWLALAVQEAEDGEASHLLADHTFDLRRNALVAAAVGRQQVAGQQVEPGASEISVASRAPGRLVITLHAPVGGLVVLAENWMPGWQVIGQSCRRLSGTTGNDCGLSPYTGLPAYVPVRTNLTFLGIPVPAGNHEIELHYRPASVLWGLGLSLATVVTLAFWFGWLQLKQGRYGRVRGLRHE